MATGKIVQVIGAVVDVEFPQDAVPRVYDALEVMNGKESLVLEVQQQLGGGAGHGVVAQGGAAEHGADEQVVRAQDHLLEQ